MLTGWKNLIDDALDCRIGVEIGRGGKVKAREFAFRHTLRGLVTSRFQLFPSMSRMRSDSIIYIMYTISN